MQQKKPIQRWISRCFLAMLSGALLASALVNLRQSHLRTINETRNFSQTCSRILLHYLGGSGSVLLTSPREETAWQNAYTYLQELCIDFQMEYIALYQLEEKKQFRRYLITVTRDEELNRYILSNMCQVDVSFKEEPPTEAEQELIDGLDQLVREKSSDARQLVQNQETGSISKGISWLRPYRDADGRLLAVIDMCHSREMDIRRTMSYFFSDIIPFSIILILGLCLLLILIRRRIIIPIRTLSESIRKFAMDSSQKPDPVQTPCNDEIREIADDYAKMTGDISSYINNIEALTREKLELGVQMDVARRIQYGMVPEKFSLSGEGFSAAAMTHPARSVGGDFYDCFLLRDGNVCLVMGDVSGKGVSAAIFMAMTKTIIREKLTAGISPAQALMEANRELCAQNPEGLFSTVFAGILDLAAGDLCYSCAGHNPPLLLKEEPAFLEPEPGIILGLFEDADLEDAHLSLSPHEGILLYTDGLTEAVNPKREFFGTERLLETVRKADWKAEPEKVLIEQINDEVNRFCDGCEPFDDMAVLLLVRTEKKEEWQELPVDLSSFEQLKQIVFSLTDNTAKTRRALLACDEALANIVGYSGAKSLLCRCELRGGRLFVALSDDGIAFDPTAVFPEERDIELLDSGGMGLNLIRNSAETMTYERRDGRNLLRLCFLL